jgi:hypothetical protein
MVTLAERFWTSDASGRPVTQLPVTERWGAAVDPGGDDCDCRGDGSCEDDPPPVGTICDFRLGLKAEPAHNVPPTWRCEEGGGGTGFQVSCVWQYSSAGKEYLGRGVDCEPLPAFTVRADVPYWWSFGRQWEQWEQVGQDCECVCQGFPGSDECEGTPGWCIGENEHWERDCDPIYAWNHHWHGWELLDLTLYGYPMPYMPNPRVQLAPYRPCGPHPVGALYVPCIEVQGVISNPKEP